MTREEILAMPAGPEMDALVAEKVLGCQVRKSTWNDERQCGCKVGRGSLDARHSDHHVHAECCHSRSGLQCEHYLLARYSTDIAAAWAVVERSAVAYGGGDVVRVRLEAHARGDQVVWFCGVPAQQPPFKATALADTPPLAICRAALLALGCEIRPSHGPNAIITGLTDAELAK